MACIMAARATLAWSSMTISWAAVVHLSISACRCDKSFFCRSNCGPDITQQRAYRAVGLDQLELAKALLSLAKLMLQLGLGLVEFEVRVRNRRCILAVRRRECRSACSTKRRPHVQRGRQVVCCRLFVAFTYSLSGRPGSWREGRVNRWHSLLR